MVQVIWSPRAWRDLDDIQGYVAFDKPNAAEQLAERLWEAGESLSAFPDRGRLIASGVRELTHVRPYLIRYVRFGQRVVIIEVRHTARRPLP